MMRRLANILRALFVLLRARYRYARMRTYMHPVTPAERSRVIDSLCRELAPGSVPLYVEVQPLTGAPANECFPLVADRVRTDGGASVLGWSIWEWPTLFVEAEFHAVWRQPDGSLLDITPKRQSFPRILFLPDPVREYEGRQVNNVRRAISRHPAVTQFIEACDAEHELLNRGERALQHGEIELDDSERQEYLVIQRAKAASQITLLRLKPNADLYDPCPCGSGRKVKWCHGIG